MPLGLDRGGVGLGSGGWGTCRSKYGVFRCSRAQQVRRAPLLVDICTRVPRRIARQIRSDDRLPLLGCASLGAARVVGKPPCRSPLTRPSTGDPTTTDGVSGSRTRRIRSRSRCSRHPMFSLSSGCATCTPCSGTAWYSLVAAFAVIGRIMFQGVRSLRSHHHAATSVLCPTATC